MLKPTKVKIVKKIYSFSPSREGCILVLRVEDVRSKQNEIGINWGAVGVQRSINRQQPMGSKKKEVLLSIANSQRVCAHSYYVLCRYVCACAQTPIKETLLLLFQSPTLHSLHFCNSYNLFQSPTLHSLHFCNSYNLVLRVNTLLLFQSPTLCTFAILTIWFLESILSYYFRVQLYTLCTFAILTILTTLHSGYYLVLRVNSLQETFASYNFARNFCNSLFGSQSIYIS